MGFDALGSGSAKANDFSAYRGAANLRNFRNNSALSLLPAVSTSKSGIGLSAAMYDSVSSQTQGLYSGGRTALFSAYATLGIDNSQRASTPSDKSADAKAEETESVEASDEVEATEAEEEAEVPVEPEKPRTSRNITDQLLQESGYVKPEANPWQYRTDFFA